MLHFDCDYMEGAHPEVMRRLLETNLDQTPGYGVDTYSEHARQLIREECGCPDADVFFLVGGTQTNCTVLDGLLSRTRAVIAAETGHISVHEAGAIEAWGHKVLTIPPVEGKISGAQIRAYLKDFYGDETWNHMVIPGAVYISNPTEVGTVYSLAELEDVSAACHEAGIPLFLDGARLAYGFAAEGNDITMKDLARLCDVFYIGGTKVGCLFGEAVVVPNKGLIPDFFTLIKQHGALLAKGRLSGIQFETLFTNGLYYEMGRHAVGLALKLKKILVDKGYRLFKDSPTNQQFFVLPNEVIDELQKEVSFELWGPRGEKETPVRFVTSWATTEETIARLDSLV